MGKKIVKGSISLPITIDGNNNIDAAIQELLECAQYPMRGLTINTNYTLSKYYITADRTDWSTGLPNTGFNIYQKMSFEDCAITNFIY
jgi:hypothetical protein